jgi:hypothetical protein
VSRRNSPIVEVICDLAEASSGLALGSDAVDDARREHLRPSSGGWRRESASRPPSFGDQSFQFVDWDELRAPWHLGRLDQRKDAAVERRAAHSKRRGRLRPRVCEPLDARRFSNDSGRRGAPFGRRRVPLRLLAPASQAAARHPYIVHKC